MSKLNVELLEGRDTPAGFSLVQGANGIEINVAPDTDLTIIRHNAELNRASAVINRITGQKQEVLFDINRPTNIFFAGGKNSLAVQSFIASLPVALTTLNVTDRSNDSATFSVRNAVVTGTMSFSMGGGVSHLVNQSYESVYISNVTAGSISYRTDRTVSSASRIVNSQEDRFTMEAVTVSGDVVLRGGGSNNYISVARSQIGGSLTISTGDELNSRSWFTDVVKLTNLEIGVGLGVYTGEGRASVYTHAVSADSIQMITGGSQKDELNLNYMTSRVSRFNTGAGLGDTLMGIGNRFYNIPEILGVENRWISWTILR